MIYSKYRDRRNCKRTAAVCERPLTPDIPPQLRYGLCVWIFDPEFRGPPPEFFESVRVKSPTSTGVLSETIELTVEPSAGERFFHGTLGRQGFEPVDVADAVALADGQVEPSSAHVPECVSPT